MNELWRKTKKRRKKGVLLFKEGVWGAMDGLTEREHLSKDPKEVKEKTMPVSGGTLISALTTRSKALGSSKPGVFEK